MSSPVIGWTTNIASPIPHPKALAALISPTKLNLPDAAKRNQLHLLTAVTAPTAPHQPAVGAFSTRLSRARTPSKEAIGAGLAWLWCPQQGTAKPRNPKE